MLLQIEWKKWSLKLPDLITEDDGNYTCVVSNKHGQIRWTFTLDVVGRFQPAAEIPKCTRLAGNNLA